MLPKPPEPSVGKNVARTIGRPAWRIHLAMGADRESPAPAAILQIFDQLLGGLELRARRLVPVEIAHQANAEPDVVHVIAVDVAAPRLPHPAIADLDLAVARRCAVADHEVIGQPVPHPAHAPMIIIENARAPLARAAIVHDDKLPAGPLHRRAANRFDVRGRKITIVG